MAHTAILNTALHHRKEIDLTPARLCGAVHVSMSCRALRDLIPKRPDSPWACTARALMTPSSKLLQGTPHPITIKPICTACLFGSGISAFLSKLRTSIFGLSSEANIPSLISRLFIFWQYPEAYHQKPVCSGSPACTGSLTPSGKNTVTQREQVCCKSHYLPK